MPTGKESTDPDAAKRYLVECDECSFERTAEGREEATGIGDHHQQETGHELVAVELPRATGPPRDR